MRLEHRPDMANVVRFPVERRAGPTLELLREMAPDVRVVLSLAAAFGIEAPAPDVRARVDAETAEHNLNQFAGTGTSMPGALDALLDPVLATAVAACRAAHDLWADPVEAPEGVRRARTAGRVWLDPLRDRAEGLMLKTAQATIEAHMRSEEAEGVARAVGLARRGEPWMPRDVRAEAEALFGTVAQAG